MAGIVESVAELGMVVSVATEVSTATAVFVAGAVESLEHAEVKRAAVPTRRAMWRFMRPTVPARGRYLRHCVGANGISSADEMLNGHHETYERDIQERTADQFVLRVTAPLVRLPHRSPGPSESRPAPLQWSESRTCRLRVGGVV